MAISKSKLVAKGWQQIKSWEQANQFIRRELKQRRAIQQWTGEWKHDFDFILAIKPGAWFKLLKGCWRGQTKLLLWRGEVSDE